MLLREGPSHGYDLLEQVRRMGIRTADAGGLYRIMRSMEKEELVSSWWEPSQSGPARRTYALTEAGEETMRSSVEGLREARSLLDALIDRYDAASQPAASGVPS